jgi:hypothetical protein
MIDREHPLPQKQQAELLRRCAEGCLPALKKSSPSLVLAFGGAQRRQWLAPLLGLGLSVDRSGKGPNPTTLALVRRTHAIKG